MLSRKNLESMRPQNKNWKRKRRRVAPDTERPTWTQQRQATSSIRTLYKSCAPVEVKTPKAAKMVPERHSEYDS